VSHTTLNPVSPSRRRESVDEKGRRYLVDGRLTVEAVECRRRRRDVPRHGCRLRVRMGWRAVVLLLSGADPLRAPGGFAARHRA
jgi:hypothetical protein